LLGAVVALLRLDCFLMLRPGSHPAIRLDSRIGDDDEDVCVTDPLRWPEPEMDGSIGA